MDAIEAFATALLGARQTRQAILAADADALAAPLDAAAAYLVQARTVAALGPVGAWKAAPGSDGVPAIAAPIFARDIHPSGAVLSSAELFVCGIELEIAFRIDRALPDPRAPDFADVLRASVTPVAVIEVIDSRMEDFRERSAVAKLADMQVNGAFVVGEMGGWPDLRNPSVTLTLDGESVLDGPQAVPGGDVFATLVEFAKTVGAHCGGLTVGQIVTTGAIGGMRLVPPGTHAAGTIAGLGAVEMAFV